MGEHPLTDYIRRMRHIAWIVRSVGAMVLLGVTVAFVDEAAGACGQAVCPVESAAIAERLVQSGELTLDGSWEYIDQDQPRIGTGRAAVGERPSPEHDEIETVNRTYKLFADYGVTERIAVGVLLPFVHRDHRHEVIEDREIESWDFSAFGDMQIWGRYSFLVPNGPGDRTLALGLGLKLPTGNTSEHNDEGEAAEITLQPGTGSTDALTSALFIQPINVPAPGSRSVWAPLFAGTSARITGSDGRFGYQAGTELLFNVGGAYPILDRLHLLGQLNFRYRDRDDSGDADGVPEENTGSEALFFSPGLRVRVLERLWAYGLVQLPIYQRVNGIQLTSDWNLLVGVIFRFSPESLLAGQR